MNLSICVQQAPPPSCDRFRGLELREGRPGDRRRLWGSRRWGLGRLGRFTGPRLGMAVVCLRWHFSAARTVHALLTCHIVSPVRQLSGDRAHPPTGE